MAKGLFDLILDNIFDNEWTGKYGEKLTERELKFVRLLGRKGKILRNVYLPKNDGGTSEVDVIYITQKGIFIFESKNYSGWIFGNEKNKNWTTVLPNKQKIHFYNPIMQNKTHLKWMKHFIDEDIPLFSVVVFSERCELKEITVYSEDIKVISISCHLSPPQFDFDRPRSRKPSLLYIFTLFSRHVRTSILRPRSCSLLQ